MVKTGAHPVVGHVCAVASAALVFVLITTVDGMVFRGALSAVHPVSERISQMMVMAVIMFLILSFFTFFTAIIPVLVVHTIAKQFSIKNIWYYVGCGALTGLALSPVAVILTPSWYTAPPVPPPLLEQVLNFARYSVPSGAAGGFAYWVATGRFVKRAQIADRNNN
jgi:hypothetical protein